MIQCDMQLKKCIYLYPNKTKRYVQAWTLYLVEYGVNVVVSRVWVACVNSEVDLTIASLSMTKQRLKFKFKGVRGKLSAHHAPAHFE